MSSGAGWNDLCRCIPAYSCGKVRAGSIILDDSYNANRVSMLAGLATLADLAAPRIAWQSSAICTSSATMPKSNTALSARRPPGRRTA